MLSIQFEMVVFENGIRLIAEIVYTGVVVVVSKRIGLSLCGLSIKTYRFSTVLNESQATSVTPTYLWFLVLQVVSDQFSLLPGTSTVQQILRCF